MRSPLHRTLVVLLVVIVGGLHPRHALAQGGAGPEGPTPRPLTPEDVVGFSGIGSSVLSPDGTLLAVVVRRPRTEPSGYRGPSISGERSDVWLVSTDTGGARNLTGGREDATGSFSPVWSPDGARLAFLSTRGGEGEQVLPWVWERASDRLRPLGTEGVLDRAGFRVGRESSSGLAWIDESALLVVSPPPGYGLTTSDIAPLQWEKTRRGAEPAVSVLESGSAATERERPGSHLLRVDAATGRSVVLAEVPPEDALQSVSVFAPAPGASRLLVVADLGPHAPPPSQPLSGGTSRLTRAAILSATEPSQPEWIEGIPGAARPAEWLPDGSAAIVPGRESDDSDESRLFLASPGDSVLPLGTDSLSFAAALWTPDGDLLVSARPVRKGVGDGDPEEKRDSAAADSLERADRANWWRMDRDLDGRRNLTADLDEVPGSLVRVGNGSTFVGVADSALWTIDAADGTAGPLRLPSAPPFTSIVWPTSRTPPSRRAVLIAETGKDDGRRLYRVDLDGDGPVATELPRPSRRASLDVFDPDLSLTVFHGTDAGGTFLWLGDGRGSGLRTAIRLNESLAGIAGAKRMLIDYRGVEGDSLKGVVLLPIGYREGTRYPLMTWVYAGSIEDDTASAQFDKGSPGALNPQLFAAHGYAVLFPSMPLAPGGEKSDPYIDLPKGVIAAVDRVIDLGIADPDRLAVGGHSYGGYSTYALVSYTDRFKAAIAMDGDANLLTSYAKFDADQRYWDNAQERREGAVWSEASQGRMGEPPWGELWRYLRNSPFFYLDRIETPLMIIQSDMDFVPIIHGEEMFSGLYRLGKPARFVRYWGEGHVPASPANILDMWQRIYGWLDEYLAEPSEPATEEGPGRP
ncbi:MAG TPA: prolyl oligopeptidase family serine peptidase [Longimicrobiales bacterium]|nr:prolyl oligopeptidase family serine peptidase [Longimicrobiales bacterium]